MTRVLVVNLGVVLVAEPFLGEKDRHGLAVGAKAHDILIDFDIGRTAQSSQSESVLVPSSCLP